MAHHEGLIGREREQDELQSALANAKEGQGGLLLIAGDAGVGKTSLAESALKQSDLFILRANNGPETSLPYGPITAILRACLRLSPNSLAECGRLYNYLAVLLPELGAPPADADRATLFEAIRCALETIAHREPTAAFIDDLQWADNTTLDLLPALAASLEHEKILIVGAYRSDEIPRGHPLRRMRSELRRKGLLREINVDPLGRDDTTTLAARALAGAPTPSLAATIYDRTQGLPFFVEELASALAASGRMQQSKAGVELIGSADLPIPHTVRDAVLLRAEKLSAAARRALEAAAALGVQFDLELAAELAGSEAGLGEAIESGLAVEVEPGRGAFRHALTREAIYGDINWARRRALHREVAARLESRGAPPGVVAEHWLAGREVAKARQAFVVSAEKSCGVHAYRDAARAARQALEIWPDGEDESQRLDMLDQLGQCAQMNGDLPEAVRAWKEVAEGRCFAKDTPKLADAQRRLASAHELQGMWEQALTARQSAAAAFAQCHLPGEAAAERIAAAAHLHGAGHFTSALDLVSAALDDAVRSGRVDLKARALALRGAILGKLGGIDAGRDSVQAGLSLALENNLIGPAAEAYQRLASVYEQAGDYIGARDAYQSAFEFCSARGVAAAAQFCLACMVVVMRDTGEWERAIAQCKDVLASQQADLPARIVANGMLGTIYAWRGQARQARSLLLESFTQARQIEMSAMEMLSAWGLACVDELQGTAEAAAEHYRFVLRRWSQTEDRHYAMPALRAAATFFANLKAQADVRACADALSTIAAARGQPDALAALGHALGEVALLDGDPQLASEQFNQALVALSNLDLPFERAQTQLRAGVALIAAGQRALGIERLTDAYRAARKLKAAPLADRAARELAALGEKVDRRLGRKAARDLEQGGLTPREREVVRRMALGRTNREIAQELFLSPRTVDMFVRNILNKLNCGSRLEAVRRAEELGLLT